MSEVLVSTEIALRPDQLVDFLLRATLQQQTVRQHHQEQQAHRVRTLSASTIADTGTTSNLQTRSVEETVLQNSGVELCLQVSGNISSPNSANLLYGSIDQLPGDTESSQLLGQSTTAVSNTVPTELTACAAALEVVVTTQRLLEMRMLELQHQADQQQQLPATTTAGQGRV